MNPNEECVTCKGTGYYFCSRGDVKCHICGGTGITPSDITLCTGCFDVIHRGHIELLEFAWTQTDGEVHVGINDDESVRKLKGDKRPIHAYEDRAYVLQAISYVNHVFPINGETVTETILKVKPRWWVKGSDYTLETLNQDERKAAESVGAEILFAPIIKGHSTTNILSKS